MYLLNNNNKKVIINRLDNYLIPFLNGHLAHVDPKLYNKCPLGKTTCHIN
jgi:hypothetical protein